MMPCEQYTSLFQSTQTRLLKTDDSKRDNFPKTREKNVLTQTQDKTMFYIRLKPVHPKERR